MRVRLICGPEGAPNFSFGLYDVDGQGGCIEFVENDWCYPSLASSFGFVPCACGATDGTVDCEHKTKTEMMSAAYDFLYAKDGEILEYNP